MNDEQEESQPADMAGDSVAMNDTSDTAQGVDSAQQASVTEAVPGDTAKFKNRKKPRLNKKRAVILCVILAIVGGPVYWFVLRDSVPVDCCTQPVVENKEELAPSGDEALQRFITPTTGETWLAEPKPLPKQGFLQYEDEVKYFEIGARTQNKIIMSVSCQLGCVSLLYEVAPDGKVTFVSRPDSQATYNADEENYADYIAAAVTINTTQTYDSLSIPRSLPVDDKYVAAKPTYNSLGEYIDSAYQDEDTKLTDVKTYGQSKVVRSERSYADTGLTSIGYAVQLPIKTRVDINIEPTALDLNNYQWSSGHSVNDKLKAIARGCGGGGGSLTRSDVLKAGDVRAVGKNPAGDDVYELVDANNQLLVKAYDEFKEYVKTDESAAYRDISKEEFVKEHGLVIVKDKYDQYLVYVREQLSPAYGCAKPVVYLYPTTPTLVNVQVGADVKISDPFYPAATGWQDVLAQPNGQLTYQGNQYGSLFWEGPGYGRYPAITSGTIVRRENALTTIRQQLAQQGLNQQEIEDFTEYWSDKLPDKPYIRLTWLTTVQLNQLAPLKISPKPDTLIRVFLDFSGLDAPINLPPQKLTAIPRQGFTVVEWGGLSPYKLY